MSSTSGLLLTGGSGYLGTYLAKGLRPAYHLETLDRTSGYDIKRRPDVVSLFERVRPAAVIHGVNYGNIAESERDRDEAYAVNVSATGTIIEQSRKSGAFLLYISSDYVFDGLKDGSFYQEDDAPNPRTFFGRTKLEAERLIQSEYPENSLIVRTGGVYGHLSRKKNNWDRWAFEKFKNGEAVEAYTDIYNTPTFIGDILSGFMRCLERRLTGLYHLAGPQRISRYDFFKKLAETCGFPAHLVKPVSSESVENLNRPKDVSLQSQALERLIGIKFADVETGLSRSHYADESTAQV
jgi:dTDP-4-dehydrorhamnose reductase